MAGDEVVQLKSDNEIVQAATQAGMTAGAQRPPVDAPQNAMKQSWKGYYVDPTQQPIHIVINDAFYAIGGFAGDIDVNSDNPSSAGNGDRYSYVDPMSSEMQYRNRVKQTKLYNYFARMVHSVVKPVFTRKVITINSYLGDSTEAIDDKQIKAWAKDCTGTGTSYDATQRSAMTEQTAHDAVYYAMTKKDGAEFPSLSVYSAVDVIFAEGDDFGKLNSIMFNRGTKVIKNENGNAEEVGTAIQFFMIGEFCYIQWWRMEKDSDEWEKFEDEKNTGIREMVAYAHIPYAVKVGEFVPTRPTMKSLLDPCLSIFQDESKLSWLYALHNLPTPYWWGKIDGAFIGAGQGFQNETSDPNNGYAPAPDYMSVPTGLLTGSLEKLQFNLERLREIAKESGIDTKTGAQAQSGYSKEFEFQATEERLRGTVLRCVEMDEWVFPMFNLYMMRDAYRYERTYPNTFYPEQQATLEDYSEWAVLAGDAGLTNTRNIIIEKGVKLLLGRSATAVETLAISKEILASTIDTKVDG
jgi:hypothetical protein